MWFGFFVVFLFVCLVWVLCGLYDVRNLHNLRYINGDLFWLFKGNLPDPGKAQDFMKKFTQVLEDDEKIRSQLEMLVSPTCSCKQAEGCVVRIALKA